MATVEVVEVEIAPKPRVVRLEVNWNEFLVLHALIGEAFPGMIEILVEEADWESERPREQLLIDGEVGRDIVENLWSAFRPVYCGQSRGESR